MVYRYDFNIIRPSSQIALGAASLGERMRSNRLAQDLAERQYQADEEKRIADMDAAERERRMKLLRMTADAYAVADELEDPAERDAVIAGLYNKLKQIDPTSVQDFSPRYEDAESAAFRAVRGPQARPEDTALMRELEAAGYVRGTPEYQAKLMEIRSRPASQVTVEAPAVSTAFQKESGKRLAQQFEELQLAGSAASDVQDKLRRVEQLSERIGTTGVGAPTIQNVKSFAKTWGVDLESLGIPDDTAPGEALNAVTTELVTQELQKFKGATTDFEFNALRSVMPGLSQTPEGRALIVETMDKLAAKTQALSRHMANWIQQTGDENVTTAGYYSELNRFKQENPLFEGDDLDRLSAVPTASAAPAAPATPAGRSADIEARIQGVMNRTGASREEVEAELRARGYIR